MKLVWKLLRQHISIPQFAGFFFANLVGTLIILLGVALAVMLGLALAERLRHPDLTVQLREQGMPMPPEAPEASPEAKAPRARTMHRAMIRLRFHLSSPT